LLWLATGFDPIQTFRVSCANQHQMLASIQRPYPWTILFDLTDFALGSSWISMLLVAYWVLSRPGQPKRWMGWVCLGQIGVVAATGLLPGETARVWLFLLPLLAVPIGEELASWPIWHKVVCYVTILMITAVMAQNMVFLHVRGERKTTTASLAGISGMGYTGMQRR
jgi:hypothetical protein